MEVFLFIIRYYPHYIIDERGFIMEKSSNKLVTLSVDFAVDILKLVKYLKDILSMSLLLIPIITAEL